MSPDFERFTNLRDFMNYCQRVFYYVLCNLVPCQVLIITMAMGIRHLKKLELGRIPRFRQCFPVLEFTH